MLRKIVKRILILIRFADLIYIVFKPFYSKKETLTYNESLKHLQILRRDSCGTSFSKNEITKDPKYNLQIIVPVYNVEQYVDKCLDSIASQETSYSFLVVVVDDGSTDSSPVIVDKYKKYGNFRIIHKENGGVSSARNKGLEIIDADYVAFVDSDDFIENNAVQNLMDFAYKNNADIVEASAYRINNGKATILKKYKKVERVISPLSLSGFFWGKIFSSKIFKDRIFPSGYLYEDTCGLTIYSLSKRAYKIPDMVYYYRNNPSSITNIDVINTKRLDTLWISKTIILEYLESGLPIDDNFTNFVFNQLITNYARIRHLDEYTNRCAFIITCELIDKIDFSNIYIKKKMLYLALKEKNYGFYKLYMKTHIHLND